MYFLDRLNTDNLFSLNFDNLAIGVDYKAMTIALAPPSGSPVNAPQPPGPLFANIDGDAGDNVLFGTNAADVINGFGGNDTLDGGTGSGVVSDGNDIINGGDGDDSIVYSATSTGSSNVDTNDGGNGNDTFSVTNLAASSFTFAVDLTAGEFTFGTFGGTVRGTLINIENVSYSGLADFDIRGDGGANILTATGDTVNIIEGMGGNDDINAGGGQDTVDAGAGNDIIRDTQGARPADNDVYDGGTGKDRSRISKASKT